MYSNLNRQRLKSVAMLAATACAVAALATAARSQDALPPQGEFALTVSLVDTHPGTPVSIGANQMAQAVNQVAQLFNSEGAGGFLHYAVGHCATFQIVDLDANTIELNGYCNFKDGDGDQAFESFATDGAVALDSLTLQSEWTGGTGKYEGIGGTFTTDAQAMVQNGNAVIIGGRMSGSYEIAGAAAEPTPVAENPAPAPEPAPAPAPEPAPAPAPAPEPAAADPALMAALMSEGRTVFSRNCARCHGADGEGGEGPRFIGYDRLSFTGVVVSQVINGGAYMPPFPALSDRQIAAVATYIRNSFGNEFGIVTEDQVAARR